MLEENIIFNEDCLYTMVERKIKYDYIITSPPDFDEIGLINPIKQTDLYFSFLSKVFSNFSPQKKAITIVIRDRKVNGTIIRKHEKVTNIMENFGWKLSTQKIWVRSYNTNLYRFPYSFILSFKKGTGIKYFSSPDVYFQETIPYDGYVDNFPLNLIKPFIEHYTEENDIIYDPFMGIGTTALACTHIKRKYIGSEISNHVWRISNKFLNNYFC